MPDSAKSLPSASKPRKKTRVRALLTEIKSRLGHEILSIRVYREHKSFIFERQIVERDGATFTVVMPFKETAAVRALLAADPYYERLKSKVGRLSLSLEKALWGTHGKPPT